MKNLNEILEKNLLLERDRNGIIYYYTSFYLATRIFNEMTITKHSNLQGMSKVIFTHNHNLKQQHFDPEYAEYPDPDGNDSNEGNVRIAFDGTYIPTEYTSNKKMWEIPIPPEGIEFDLDWVVMTSILENDEFDDGYDNLRDELIKLCKQKNIAYEIVNNFKRPIK